MVVPRVTPLAGPAAQSNDNERRSGGSNKATPDVLADDSGSRCMGDEEENSGATGVLTNAGEEDVCAPLVCGVPPRCR